MLRRSVIEYLLLLSVVCKDPDNWAFSLPLAVL